MFTGNEIEPLTWAGQARLGRRHRPPAGVGHEGRAGDEILGGPGVVHNLVLTRARQRRLRGQRQRRGREVQDGVSPSGKTKQKDVTGALPGRCQLVDRATAPESQPSTNRPARGAGLAPGDPGSAHTPLGLTASPAQRQSKNRLAGLRSGSCKTTTRGSGPGLAHRIQDALLDAGNELIGNGRQH